MTYTVRPISDRTAFTGKHVDSQFTVSWSRAEQLLLAELAHLRARDVVVELDLPESGIRLDGRPRADARAASPAVRVAFDTEGGPMVFATDKFVRPSYRWHTGMQADWQHNVYAIAKGLEALRLVDRYGIVERDQQYAGFKQLGAGRSMPASHMTSTDAELIIRKWSGHHGGPYELDALIKRARFATHPDRHDGDRAAWDQVEEAAKVLGVIA